VPVGGGGDPPGRLVRPYRKIKMTRMLASHCVFRMFLIERHALDRKGSTRCEMMLRAVETLLLS
jgi:glycerol-3-phosphate responsive antiterminator